MQLVHIRNWYITIVGKSALDIKTGKITGWLGSKENTFLINLDVKEVRTKSGLTEDIVILLVNTTTGLSLIVLDKKDKVNIDKWTSFTAGFCLVYGLIPQTATDLSSSGVYFVTRSLGPVDDNTDYLFVTNEENVTAADGLKYVSDPQLNPWATGWIFIDVEMRANEIRI